MNDSTNTDFNLSDYNNDQDFEREMGSDNIEEDCDLESEPGPDHQVKTISISLDLGLCYS